MKLHVLTPGMMVLEDEEVRQITAEAGNGSFSLLPRHIDFVAALVPGLLSCVAPGGERRHFAVDEGILVKCGDDVLVAVRRAVGGADLESLERTVAEEFARLDEHERTARSAVARLEAGAIRRFAELGAREHG